jgi:hypothetical protein
LASAIAAAVAAPAAFARQDRQGPDGPRASAQTLAIIGDIPYGPELIDEFPADKQLADPMPAGHRIVKSSDIQGCLGLVDETFNPVSEPSSCRTRGAAARSPTPCDRRAR